MNTNLPLPKHKFINKALYFPNQGILVVGDLHLGYEIMLKTKGVQLPFNQLETTKKEIEIIINQIKKKKKPLNKIILLGDIKHLFSFFKAEFFEIKNFLKFLEKFVSKKNIILIKGNHDKTLSKKEKAKYKDYYIESNIAFTHGDILYPEILDKSIRTIVIGHLHPAITLKDPDGIKKEKHKIFLVGKYKRKEMIIVPSFLPLIAGTEINEAYGNIPGFSIIKKYQLKHFKEFIVSKNRIN